MIRSVFAGSLLGLALLAQPAAAQSRRVSYDRVPPGQLPPAGLCRVWIDGVPPGRQPGVTSCHAARAQAARYGGRVIYGDDSARPGNGKAKGKYKDKKHDRYDRRDRDDDRYDRDHDRRDRDDDRYDRDDERHGGRNRDRYCLDANRDGRCDVTQGRTQGRTQGTVIPGTIPGTTYPRGSTTPTTTQRRQTVTERLEELRRMEEEARAARRGQ